MTGAAGLRVVLADDHPVVRDGYAALLHEAGIEVVAGVGDPAALREAVATTRPDVAVVDIRMPPHHRFDGLEAAVGLRRTYADLGVLLLSQYQESFLLDTLLDGRPKGVGYLLKERATGAALVDGVVRVARGGVVVDPAITDLLLRRAGTRLGTLTPREREVLDLVAQGYSDRAIGDALYLSLKTVHTHVSRIFTKLGLAPDADRHRRVLAVLTYLRHWD